MRYCLRYISICRPANLTFYIKGGIWLKTFFKSQTMAKTAKSTLIVIIFKDSQLIFMFKDSQLISLPVDSMTSRD